ncbi:sulfatase family protein [Cyclobacterium plantarum]|uniref:Sulfatase n=1 Tax=Cyclobacterium plantarum TaxID=2716263 RepID=A0ABX0HCD1_9BACT|nr:sulfatase [Cyclobacterium plantarum]NHE58076.1 sulfatase [Cyclobacterium plantarum]
MKNVLKIIVVFAVFLIFGCSTSVEESEKRSPNILFVISDDQSYYHTSFAGSKFVNTPAFDRVAREGVYFTNCIAGSPGCAPSRSSIITGRHHWQNEQSGQHAAPWLKKHVPFVDLLDQNGYITGRTGKGVSPFRYARDENDSLWRETDAAGIAHSNIRYETGTEDDKRPAAQINSLNYFENFKYFMENVREADDPFFFWYGATEPHRAFEQDSWKRTDKKLSDAEVPGFLPDHPTVRGDLLDYAVEIEWFDQHLQYMLEYLEETGELDNTIIIVTSDNGMAFPRAKANGYDYGIHVPLAVRYPKAFPGDRMVNDPVNFIDLAPTILDLTETSDDGMLPITGKSLRHLLESEEHGDIDPSRKYVFSGRERHSSSRYQNWGYPQRVIRSQDHLLIWNIKPDRWPAGAPQRINPDNEDELLPLYGMGEDGEHHSDWAFTDVDAAPTKSYLVENRDDEAVRPFFEAAFEKNPEVQLYDIQSDPDCMNNLADDPDYAEIKEELRQALLAELRETGDPRVVGPDPEVFDSYLRYSPMREFPKPIEGSTLK